MGLPRFLRSKKAMYGVNRYIYETYYKLHSTVATKEYSWTVCVTGDLARVNFRGKGITMCGVKSNLIRDCRRSLLLPKQ